MQNSLFKYSANLYILANVPHPHLHWDSRTEFITLLVLIAIDRFWIPIVTIYYASLQTAVDILFSILNIWFRRRSSFLFLFISSMLILYSYDKTHTFVVIYSAVRAKIVPRQNLLFCGISMGHESDTPNKIWNECMRSSLEWRNKSQSLLSDILKLYTWLRRQRVTLISSAKEKKKKKEEMLQDAKQ